jgi:CRISPR-associated protein (Cas_Cmr5)
MPIRKDQQLALWAYQRARTAPAGYETAVQTFAAVLLRSGLEVAVSVLERNLRRDEYKELLRNLASRLEEKPADDTAAVAWAERLRGSGTDLSRYMLDSRDARARITWLRRACRAVSAQSESEGENASRV